MGSEQAVAEKTATAKPSFSGEEYELTDTSVLTLKNKRGDEDLLGSDGKPVTVEIWSPGSEAGVQAMHQAGRAMAQRTSRMVRGENDSKDAEKAERERAVKLTKITKRISDNFPISPANLYANPKLQYISAQVEKHFSDFGNF
jgi:hypothetical protein